MEVQCSVATLPAKRPKRSDIHVAMAHEGDPMGVSDPGTSDDGVYKLLYS